MNKKLPLLSILAIAFFLTGCDSQPSDSDITQAIQNFTDETNGSAPSDNMKIIFNSAKKIGCKDKESDGGYKCTIEYNVKLPFIGEKASTMEFKFFKVDGKWKAAVPLK
ncbi:MULTISPECIES: hypothetical protein [unclassified Brenneria]|uniref:hypothetical protein n=1 Tax=unclassified Brenneria TaxID=2634434 RepID=UPI001554E976|nr:hypothetical protein [Brenneria sp. hezel4-2-4]MEE3652639.1 hypothetical protein [Brenneria sp. HEZEL_4_2_4]NPD02597.1 hypothetical protein [Brenneria sp. hezel4-2-4]